MFQTAMVGMEDALLAMSLAVASGKNVILWGRGGEGKSKLADEFLSWLEKGGCVTHTQQLNIGSNPYDLLGGLSPEHVERHIFDRPNYEKSWAALSDVARFEEGLDASPRVLSMWKDLLTSGAWRYRDITLPLRTRTLIITTNHDPQIVAKTDPSVAALIERFPISVEVGWGRYKSQDYDRMFGSLFLGRRAKKVKDVPVLTWDEYKAFKPAKLTEKLLADMSFIMGEMVNQGARVSPRTAVYAAEIVATHAALEGRKEATREDLEVLWMLQGIDKNLLREVISKMTRTDRVREQSAKIADTLDELKNMASKLDGGNHVKIAKRAHEVRVILSETKWEDEIAQAARTAGEAAKALEADCMKRAGILETKEKK